MTNEELAMNTLEAFKSSNDSGTYTILDVPGVDYKIRKYNLIGISGIELNNKLIGIILLKFSAKKNSNNKLFFQVSHIAVDKEYQGKGYGIMLLVSSYGLLYGFMQIPGNKTKFYPLSMPDGEPEFIRRLYRSLGAIETTGINSKGLPILCYPLDGEFEENILKDFRNEKNFTESKNGSTLKIFGSTL